MKGVRDTHLRKSKAWKEVEKREKEEKIGKGDRITSPLYRDPPLCRIRYI
jgi:hypothetical protein